MKTREKILTQSLKLFNAQGMAQVGVRDIARHLGVSPGNLSYHFPKKEDLVLELVNRMRAVNDQCYNTYFSGIPSLPGFLQTMRGVFSNQYDHQGLLIGQEEMRRILFNEYDYKAVEERRKTHFKTIFLGLAAAGELKLESEDADFLVSYMTLFGRFWILESFVSTPELSKEEAVEKYLRLLARQLALFATEQGKGSLNSFFE
ncbi:MAG: TetR/AcrR family transcriptional regulator [Saprospirales bacterium]|nr:TetR/AcrR family transcriptional regulator [Saprospirales bacterium]